MRQHGFLVTIFMLGLVAFLWLVCDPIFVALYDIVVAELPGASDGEKLIISVTPFVVFGGIALWLIIRFTGRNREG